MGSWLWFIPTISHLKASWRSLYPQHQPDCRECYYACRNMTLISSINQARISRSQIPCQEHSWMSRWKTNEEQMKSQIHLVYANLPSSDQVLKEVKDETCRDPVSKKIMQVIQEGWPKSKKKIPSELKEYWKDKEELSESGGIILKGNRILIPSSLRYKMLEKLHQGHPGIEKTKQRARQTLYWPGINANIDNLVFRCTICQESRNANSREPLSPKYPWQVIGTDIFHWNNDNFLLVVDYYSRYWEIVKLQSMKSERVII